MVTDSSSENNLNYKLDLSKLTIEVLKFVQQTIWETRACL